MSTTAITMEELESERAELLPSRETLHCCCGPKGTSGSSSSVNQGNVAGNGNLVIEANNNNSGWQLFGF